nr:integrase, catalytic region, zinc finger, CCHC-type, peptidase aspartic, catalytic [Tanacetum cinerariifolium]
MDMRLKDLMMMVLVMHTEEDDTMLHMKKTGMWMLVVEIDVGGITVDAVQIILRYLDSGCSKHMIGDRSQLINFVQKFLGTVKFGNDHVAKIMGYGDYQIGNVTISWVYYVEGLGHNLFFVGQFCDSDLEIAFRQHTCFIRNLDGVDLLTSSRGSNLYTLSLQDMMASSPICLLSKASKTKSWLWHRRLSHLNFGTIKYLARQNSGNSEESNLSSSTTIVEVPKELPKVSMVNSSLKKLKFHLASFDMVVKERTTVTAITEGTWGFEHTKACFRDEIIPFVKALKELFNSVDQFLIDKLTEVQNVFNQIEQAVEQHCVEKNKF